MDSVFVLRVLAGGAAAVYAAYLVARAFRLAPSSLRGEDDDMRTVLGLAARFRAAGKTEAVKLCQQLLDELLKVPA